MSMYPQYTILQDASLWQKNNQSTPFPLSFYHKPHNWLKEKDPYTLPQKSCGHILLMTLLKSGSFCPFTQKIINHFVEGKNRHTSENGWIS